MIIGYGHLPEAAGPDGLATLRLELGQAGAEAVFVETAPHPRRDSAAQLRPALDCALASAGRGDVLLTLTPTQLAQTVAELLDINTRLAAQGAHLRILQVNGQQELNTGTASGAMMLAALGLLAAFERPGGSLFDHAGPDLAPESFPQRRSRGRPPTASAKAAEIARLRAAGMGATDIADRLKICRASVYRILNMGDRQSVRAYGNTDS